MAVGLLPASINDAFAGCWCGRPGIICCDVGIARGCEPITTPAARAMCPRPGGGGGARNAPNSRGGGNVQSKLAPASDPNMFRPATSHQIQPLRCPRAAPLRVGETFYGGTICAPMGQPRAAAVEPLPFQQPPPAPAPSPAQMSKPEGPPQPQPQPSEFAPPQPSQPQPSQDATDNDLSKNIAKNNLLDILEAGTGLPRTVLVGFGVAGAVALVGGFAGSSVIMPFIRAWTLP
jgi:hypothetical protein